MKETLERLGVDTDRCIMGASTASPCPFPAEAPPARWSEDAPVLCAFHAAIEPLAEEDDDLALALEAIKKWEEAANEFGNRPLLDVLFRARLELGQRKELIAGALEDLEEAEKKLMRSK